MRYCLCCEMTYKRGRLIGWIIAFYRAEIVYSKFIEALTNVQSRCDVGQSHMKACRINLLLSV